MKICVVGSGAVGGWYAGLLALAGNEVHCVTRSDYAVIRKRGLILQDTKGERSVMVASARPDTASIGVCDLVIVAAKTTANGTIAQLITPLLGSHTILLTLQNGMGNVETFTSLLPANRVVAGLCFVCINRTTPGVISNTMHGYIRFAAAQGESNSAVDFCVQAFRRADVECDSEPSLDAVLWKKLCWNIPFNGLAIAGGGITTDLILANPELNGRADRLMHEVREAAKLCGVPFSEQHIERQFAVTSGMGAYRPSSLIDYLDGRDVEVDALWGIPLQRGLLAGARMPELSRLITEINSKLSARKIN
jgi:2-dehydropantoate 2-reductase